MAENKIVGILTPAGSITGTLSPKSTGITGILSRNSREPAPYYDGPYTVTPTEEEQVLPTELRTTEQDIIIGPIPENYGLITYDGTKITVS